MPVTLDAAANERSTYPITLSFYDGGEDGDLVTPSSATWSLYDPAGGVVNGRDGVALSVTDGVGVVVLTGADLAVSGVDPVTRHVVVEATYTSTTYGAGLSLTEEYIVTVTPLRGIP